MDEERESIRIGVKKTGMRWQRARQTLEREDRPYADRLSRMAEAHASRGASAFEDPLEAAVYSVFLEMLKELERKKDRGEGIRGRGRVLFKVPAASTVPQPRRTIAGRISPVVRGMS